MSIVMTVGALATNCGNFNAGMATAARSLSSMASMNMLPKVLDMKHPKYQTPWVATVFSGLVASVLIVLPFNDIVSAEIWITTLVILAVYATFLYLRHAQPDMERPFRVPIEGWILPMFIVVVPTIICGFILITSGQIIIMWGCIMVAAGLISYPVLCYAEIRSYWRDKGWWPANPHTPQETQPLRSDQTAVN